MEKDKKFKVLHCPVNIANQAWEYSQALKKLGIESTTLTYSRNVFNYSDDICLHLNLNKKILNIWKIPLILTNFFKSVIKYNVFHFHFGHTLLPGNMDLPILKLLKKKMVMQYWGSDIRIEEIARKKNKYQSLIKCSKKSDKKIIKKIKRVAKYIDVALVADYELYEYVQPFFKRIEIVLQAIDLEKITPIFPSKLNDRPLIIHAPSEMEIKGTKYILEAIKRLKRDYQFEFQLVHNLPHSKAQKIYKRADIIVDQLLCGSYGLLSIEAMALGKPVICYIRDDLLKYKPDLPIVNANPENIYEKLKLLIENPVLRQDLGIKGRKYVEKYHESSKIAKRLIEIYKTL
jgi:glycosyltransferase involved in cell wall biosynthesis